MAINLIILAVTLLMGGFLLVWWLCPRLRPWIEEPKYRILDWERKFSDSGRTGEPSQGSKRD
jgi:hypothetical protein